MRRNRRETKSIAAALLAVAVVLSPWVFPTFAEGSAAEDPATGATEKSFGAEQQAETDQADTDEAEPKPGPPPAKASSKLMAAFATVNGTEVTVHMENSGGLQTALADVLSDITNNLADVDEITKLTVTGFMDVDDMDYIWNDSAGGMALLKDLDLSGATYVGSGGRLKEYQFRSNGVLETMALPSGISHIADSAFYGSALRSIDFSSCTDLTGIGESVFENCTSLESVDLSACVNLLSIGPSAFKGCTSLESAHLPDRIPTIDGYTFQGCTALTDVRFPAGLLTIGSFAFDGSFQGSPASIDLSGCRDLTIIGPNAFHNSTNLEQVVFPKGLIAIWTGAFEDSGITSADLSGNVDLTTLSQQVFRSCTNLRSVDFSNTGIIDIPTDTFYLCTSLQTVILPDRMNSIADYAFYGNTSLQNVTLPSGLTTIGNNTFEDCTNLVSVDLSGCTDLNSIGNNTFRNTTLQSIDLSFCTNLTTIGNNTFNGCSQLQSIRMPNTGGVVGADSSTFSGCSNVKVIVPTALLGAYRADSIWYAAEQAQEVDLRGGWTITVNQTRGGMAAVDSRTHEPGDTVTLLVDAQPGYTHTVWSRSPNSLNLVSLGNDTYQFDMPAQDVIITPLFTDGSGSGGSSGGQSTPSNTVPKALIPSSAFAWDGERTLTINHEAVTRLGLIKVAWDGVETSAYSAYNGSVILRFDREFMDGQAAGNHTIRVEFLNHYGETTVHVGAETEAADDVPTGLKTYNPNTGGIIPIPPVFR